MSGEIKMNRGAPVWGQPLQEVRQAQLEVVTVDVNHGMMKNFNYIIYDRVSRAAVVIDPAWQLEKLRTIIADLRINIMGVLITHSHPDHLNLASSFSDIYQCPVWMSQQEQQYSNYKSARLKLIEQDIWQIGPIRVFAILTPGHTPGCICYLIGNSLFTGDVLFAEGCGMCPTIEAAKQMYFSLEKIKDFMNPDTRVYPGHSYGKVPGQPFSNVQKENIYLQFQNADSFSAFRMRSGQNRIKMFQFS